MERENLVDLEVELGLGMPLPSIDSSSHRIRVEHRTGFRYRIALAETPTPADRDFTLSWKPEVGDAPRAALFTESLDGDNYVLLMLLPPQVEGEGARLPRETIFVIDTSGAMHGTSIQQARTALLLALARLQPEDTFNVIQFNSRTSKLFEQPVAAARPAIERARAYVERLGANGGTEMLSALTAALSQRGELESNRVRQVIFMTDGSVGNEAQLFTSGSMHGTSIASAHCPVFWHLLGCSRKILSTSSSSIRGRRSSAIQPVAAARPAIERARA